MYHKINYFLRILELLQQPSNRSSTSYQSALYRICRAGHQSHDLSYLSFLKTEFERLPSQSHGLIFPEVRRDILILHFNGRFTEDNERHVLNLFNDYCHSLNQLSFQFRSLVLNLRHEKSSYINSYAIFHYACSFAAEFNARLFYINLSPQLYQVLWILGAAGTYAEDFESVIHALETESQDH